MLIRCPVCRSDSRTDLAVGQSRVINYPCPSCHNIVRIDLAQQEVKPSSSADSLQETKRKKKRILVADDSATVRGVVGRLLNEAGYDVLHAADGQQALDQAHKERPDLIVLDVVMPKMTGVDVVREIRKSPRLKDTPILIISDVVSVNEAHGFLRESEVAGFVSRTQIMASLVSRVQEVLSK